MLTGFAEHMCHDFNSSGALGVLSKPLAEANTLLASGKGVSPATRYLTLEKFVTDMAEIAGVLGCFGQDPANWLISRRQEKSQRLGLDVARVESLIQARITARQEKNWATADQIRDELTALGVGVQDGAEGSEWSFL